MILLVTISFNISVFGTPNLNTIEIVYELNTKMDLYKVGEGDIKSPYSLISPFSEYNVNVMESNLTNSAYTLSSYIKRDAIKSNYSGIVKNGNLIIEGVEDGLYLIIGESVDKENKRYTPTPVLVLLNTDVKLKVKSDIDNIESDNETVNYKVKKEWYLDNIENRPKTIKVDLLKNGKYYDSFYLSDSNNWSKIIHNLDKDNEWSIVESDVPNGYRTVVEINSRTFIIKNTYYTEPIRPEDDDTIKPEEDIVKPEEDAENSEEESVKPDEEIIIPTESEDSDNTKSDEQEKLPQSGYNWYSVYAVIIIGIAFILAGYLELVKKKK